MSFKFPKHHKLSQTTDFDRCIQLGEPIKVKPFSCFLLANDRSHHRLGMIISKRWHKRAHKRNQLKRWIRETFRVQSATIAYDIVLIPFRNRPIYYEDVKALWQQLNLD